MPVGKVPDEILGKVGGMPVGKPSACSGFGPTLHQDPTLRRDPWPTRGTTTTAALYAARRIIDELYSYVEHDPEHALGDEVSQVRRMIDRALEQ